MVPTLRVDEQVDSVCWRNKFGLIFFLLVGFLFFVRLYSEFLLCLRRRFKNRMASQPSSSAVRALALEYKSMQEEPVEGFRVKLMGEDNLFEWEVAIFGPPETLYKGGYFKVCFLFFPSSVGVRG